MTRATILCTLSTIMRGNLWSLPGLERGSEFPAIALSKGVNCFSGVTFSVTLLCMTTDGTTMLLPRPLSP